MDLSGLRSAFDQGIITACNIAPTISDRGFQVSVMRPGSTGWGIFYGHELSDVLERAVQGGPQMPEFEEPEEWGGLV